MTFEFRSTRACRAGTTIRLLGLIAFIAGLVAAFPAYAPPVAKMLRIGVLWPTTPPPPANAQLETLLKHLRELGWQDVVELDGLQNARGLEMMSAARPGLIAPRSRSTPSRRAALMVIACKVSFAGTPASTHESTNSTASVPRVSPRACSPDASAAPIPLQPTHRRPIDGAWR